MHCLWWPSVNKHCHQGWLTIQPDFEYLLGLLPAGQRAPSAKNTLWFDKWDPGAVSSTTFNYTLDPTGGKYAKSILITRTGDEVLSQNSRLADVPVLYIGAPLKLKAPVKPGDAAEEEAFKEFKATCEWIKPEYLIRQEQGRR